MTMTQMETLFGVSTVDVTNWHRRGLVHFPGRQGTIRKFGPEDRGECLCIVFAKALSRAMDIGAAIALARTWVEAEAKGRFPRFWVMNGTTGSTLEFANAEVIEPGLFVAMADEVTGGYVGGLQEPERPATVLVVIDRGGIVARLDSALAAEDGE